MLTIEEKERLKAEERLRAEIRSELAGALPRAAPTTLKSTVWFFLNSTFGLWLLSSVILAGIAKWYDVRETERREDEKKKLLELAEYKATTAARERLLLEISYRFSSTMSELKRVHEKIANTASQEMRTDIVRALDIFERPPGERFQPLFLEYRNFSGLALIAELQRHVSDVEKPHLTKILRDTSVFIKEEAARSDNAETAARELLLRLRYAKWNALGFPYTTCTWEKPFC